MSSKMVRIPADLYQRAERLLSKMKNSQLMIAAGRRSVSVVIRLALLYGIDELEEKLKESSIKKRRN